MADQSKSQEKTEETLSREASLTRWFALTIVGVALNSIFAEPTYEVVFHVLTGVTTPEPSWLIVSLILTFVLMPIYCWAASTAFYPKRLVNPLHIQIATAGIVTAIVIVANAHLMTYPQLFQYFIGGSIATFLITIIILGIFGILQLLIVRWLVGLVGTTDDLDRKTFLIKADNQTVSNLLLSHSFLGAWNLVFKKIGANLLEVYTSYVSSWQVRLVLGPSEKSDESILATVAFEKQYYTILKSKEVSDYRDDMVDRLKRSIGAKKFRLVDCNDEVSHAALRSALNVTKPKTLAMPSEIGEIPSFYRNILILMGIITATVTLLFAFSILTLDLFVTSIVMIIIGLVVELGPKIKEILDSKKSVRNTSLI